MDAAEVKEADTRPHRRVRGPGARCTRHCWGDEEVRRKKGERRGMGGDGATAHWKMPEPSVMDTRVVTSLNCSRRAASIIKVREGKRKGLEAERKERVAAETERLREEQKERKERNEKWSGRRTRVFAGDGGDIDNVRPRKRKGRRQRDASKRGEAERQERWG